jgi:hypothetical protein
MPYVSGLLTAFKSRYVPDPASLIQLAHVKVPFSILSPKAFPTRKSRGLAIAPETVKSHVKHIFIKLGAKKRAQAVARAQSLVLAVSPLV